MTPAQLQWKCRRQPKKKYNRRRHLNGGPQTRGTCMKVFVTTPRKPNSGLRKVTRVFTPKKLRMLVYIEGEGHNLQKHSVILIRGGRAKDVPTVRYTSMRGKLDLKPLVKIRNGRSLYGIKLPDGDPRRKPYSKIKVWG